MALPPPGTPPCLRRLWALSWHSSPSQLRKGCSQARPAARPRGEGAEGAQGPSRALLLSGILCVVSVFRTTGSLRSPWLGGRSPGTWGPRGPLGCAEMRSHDWPSRSSQARKAELKLPSLGGRGRGRRARKPPPGQQPVPAHYSVRASRELGPQARPLLSLGVLIHPMRWGTCPPRRSGTRSPRP